MSYPNTNIFKELLIVGSHENRKLIYYDESDDMPILLDDNNKPCIEISNFEEYKTYLFTIIQTIDEINEKNIAYTSVDPAFYSNNKKDISLIDNERYIGHISSFLIDLPNNKKYDYIFITNCYINLFEQNIKKIKSLLNDNGYIIILKGVPYKSFGIIKSKYFKNVCNYKINRLHKTITVYKKYVSNKMKKYIKMEVYKFL